MTKNKAFTPPPPPLTMREAICAELKAHMARRGLRQRHIAQALGVDQQWVSRRLNGDVHFSIDDLEAFCTVLNVDVKDLLSGLPTAPVPAALDRRTLRKRGVVCNDSAAFVPFSVLELAA